LNPNDATGDNDTIEMAEAGTLRDRSPLDHMKLQVPLLSILPPHSLSAFFLRIETRPRSKKRAD
jgi:hypothetical protein